jgi:hypothetical protein
VSRFLSNRSPRGSKFFSFIFSYCFQETNYFLFSFADELRIFSNGERRSARNRRRWRDRRVEEEEEDEEDDEEKDEASRLLCSFSSAQNILLGFLDPQIYFFTRFFSHPLKKHHKIKFQINYLITFLNLIIVTSQNAI